MKYDDNGVRLRAIYDVNTDSIGIFALLRDGEGRTLYALPPEFAKLPEGRGGALGMVYLDADKAQELVDDLWRIGIRPREAAGSVGQLTAVQAHVDDLRRVAFYILKIKDGK